MREITFYKQHPTLLLNYRYLFLRNHLSGLPFGTTQEHWATI